MLDRSTYFVREHVGFLKLTDTYDILDPESQQQLGIAREEISGFKKILRLLISKQFLSTEVKVYTGTAEVPQELQFSIKRSPALLRAKVQVINAEGHVIGHFKSKLFSIGGAFTVYSGAGHEVAIIKGDWKGWNFRFLSGNEELGKITKKWNGLGKELFTSADNYIIDIHGEVDRERSILFLAAGLAIDTVFKEKN